MANDPLAFFITFTTYGTWLHGKEPGSVDREHNQIDMPFLAADSRRAEEERDAMVQSPYLLDAPRRALVLATIREVCRFRQWRLLACHVRSTHIHLLVNADAAPEKIMNDCKAYASRRLHEAGLDEPARKRWTRHGSTRYVWDATSVGNIADYVLNRQGEPMEIYRDDAIDERRDTLGDPLPDGRGSDAFVEPRP